MPGRKSFNRKYFSYVYQVAPIKNHLPKACPHGNSLILDSEVNVYLMYNSKFKKKMRVNENAEKLRPNKNKSWSYHELAHCLTKALNSQTFKILCYKLLNLWPAIAVIAELG